MVMMIIIVVVIILISHNYSKYTCAKINKTKKKKVEK